MTPRQLRDSIERALRYRAPARLGQLEAEGALAKYLNELVAIAEDEISTAEAAGAALILRGDDSYLDKVAALLELRKRAETAAINAVTEQ